ncbi:MAG: hypothetical protein HOQ24_07410 [Mycobacteriaceae bacterium]|nr:hypothetical protein [Mycobacteriaceae bacterium]
MVDPALPYVLVDERIGPVVVVGDYLRELTASDCSPLTVRSMRSTCWMVQPLLRPRRHSDRITSDRRGGGDEVRA